jgi:hypothetical protein
MIYKPSHCEHTLKAYRMMIHESSRCEHARIYYCKCLHTFYDTTDSRRNIQFILLPRRLHAVCTIPSACRTCTDVITVPYCQRSAYFIWIYALSWRLGHVQNLRKRNLRREQFHGSLKGTWCGLGMSCLPVSSPHIRWVTGSSVQDTSAPWVHSLSLLSRTTERAAISGVATKRSDTHFGKPSSTTSFSESNLHWSHVSVISYMLGSVPESPLDRNYVPAWVSHISQVSIVMRKSEEII